MDEHGARGGIYGHASAGCLHIRPVLDLKNGSGVRTLRKIAEHTLEVTLRLGGAMSSEHGDGMARGEWLQRTYGEDLVQSDAGSEESCRPDNILNPRKMLDAPPMDSNLRYGSGYASRAWVPGIDFAPAAAWRPRSSNATARVCAEKTPEPCALFQATREERDSTRGRANLLRASSQPAA